jgi:hypothetical protein
VNFSLAIESVTSVSMGAEHSCALVSSSGSSQVLCWGRVRPEPQTTTLFVPTLIPGTIGAIQLSSGANHTCAIVPSGNAPVVKCWEYSASFELGSDGEVGDVADEVLGISD